MNIPESVKIAYAAMRAALREHVNRCRDCDEPAIQWSWVRGQHGGTGRFECSVHARKETYTPCGPPPGKEEICVRRDEFADMAEALSLADKNNGVL